MGANPKHEEGITMDVQPAMTAAPEGPQAETDDGGYTIEIKVDGQGKISVCVENETGEAPEGVDAGAAPSEDEGSEMGQYQPAANIKEALTMALDIYKANGQAKPADALGKRLGSAGFASGYDEG